jgi:hypothetical protein
MDMDERCNAIVDLGGKWCRCKAECPDLKILDWGSRHRPHGCDDPPQYIVEPEDPTEENMYIRRKQIILIFPFVALVLKYSVRILG